MKTFLVWLTNWKGTELQIWWFDPAKMLRKNPYVIKVKEIPTEIAEKLSIDDLRKIYE